MKKTCFVMLAISGSISTTLAQNNFLDNYIGAAVTTTVIASTAESVLAPTDLDFKPNSNELWVANYGTNNGGSTVLIYNAGMPNQTSEYRKDTHTSHFMIYPSAIAFGDDGFWANTNEIQSTNGPTSTFMGPALWTSDTAIHARVFQQGWVNGYPLGSHYDMLHQSPFAMGIAHDSALAYWLSDGYFDNICLYNFVQHHGPGYENHSAGKIYRYLDVPFTRVPNVPSHMVLDKSSGWLYFIDGGPKQIKRLDTNSGTIGASLNVPPTAAEPLAEYKRVLGATVEVLDSLTTQPCGMDYYNNRLIVSDYTNGDIRIYNTAGAFSLLGTIATGLPGIMGVKIGPDGRIWFVNKTTNSVYRLDLANPAADVSLTEITAPAVQNFNAGFYDTGFNLCDGSITPSITIKNKGTSVITSIDFEYTVDGGAPVPYSWTGNLSAGWIFPIVLPQTNVSNGPHTLRVSAVTVNGSPDDILQNNVLEGSFRTINPAVPVPYTEGFDATSFPPAGWNYIHYNPNNKMNYHATGGFGLSTGSVKMDNFSGDLDITGQEDFLMTPLVDMTAATANSWLRFNVAYAKYNASSNDALEVRVSTDCGNTWNAIYNKSGTALSTAPASTSSWTPSASQWRTDSVNLAAYSGQPDVLFMFTAISNFGNNLYVDDVFIGDLSTGIADASGDGFMSLSPNPASASLNIRFEKHSHEIIHGELLSADGKSVYSFAVPPSQTETELDVSRLPAGVYTVKLTTGKAIRFNLFVKQ